MADAEEIEATITIAHFNDVHIVPVLNYLGIDIACYGNHDFDLGEQRLVELSAQCNFPWLLSNAFSPSGSLLASAHHHIIKQSGPLRIGFFGLAGTDWPSNCQHLPSDARIEDSVKWATREAALLREEHRADIVIGVTHMRMEEDMAVTKRCPGVDLILGGHDHEYMLQGSQYTDDGGHAEGNIRIVKSGTDFREFSVIKIRVERCHAGWRIRKVQVNRVQEAEFEVEDSRMLAIIADVDQRIASLSHNPIAYTAVPLHGLTSHVRSAETNVGNLLADAVRAYYDTDIAFVNSGSIRCDRIIPAGVLTVRDIIDIVPFDNPWVVKRMSGQVILEALENSVSDMRSDGRFLQLSGLNIVVDFGCNQGQRLMSASLSSGAPLDLETDYTVTMQRFIAEGFDGFTCFRNAANLVDLEAAMTDTSLLMALLSSDSRQGADETTDGSGEKLDRAARAIVLGTRKGLPVLSPAVTGRIRAV
ncbi:Metallo-dependent phosphatase [Schizophyllum commune Loenen D]|nr:Metallo-dependent phosphatase [Schizophyllum commune Loenen D]